MVARQTGHGQTCSAVLFDESLSQELMNVLAQASDLRVISRTSAFSLKQRSEDLRTIARSVGVSHVLEGSVRRQGNRVRVTAQLIRADDGFHLWLQNYDRTLDDVFAIQDDIAANVLQALEIVLDDVQRQRMRRAGVRDVEAFIAFTKGYALWDQAWEGGSIERMLTAAHAQFAEAIARVPTFSTAHFLDATLQIQIMTSGAPGHRSRVEQERALAALRKSLDAAYEFSPDPLHRAIVDVDRVLFSDDWRLLRAKIELALSEPGCAPTNLLETAMWFGYATGLVDLYRRETQCDPKFAIPWWQLVTSSLWTGDQAQTLRLLDEADRQVPGSGIVAGQRTLALLALGRIDDAAVQAQRVAPDVDLAAVLARAAVPAARGRRDEALEEMERLLQPMPKDARDPRMFVYAMVGDRGRANELANELDARPGGPALVSMWVMMCVCGAPFDLDAVPNLQARIAEAGLPWPLPTIIEYPLKNW